MQIYFELKTKHLGSPGIARRNIDCDKRFQLHYKYIKQSLRRVKGKTADQSNISNEWSHKTKSQKNCN